MSTAIVKAEPLKNQRLDPRDERAARLRDMVRDFVAQSFSLLGEVRQDFLEKGRDEKILGCSTWSEYCQNVLGYSESHVRNMMAQSGNNPAKKFAARKPHKRKKSNRDIAEEGLERQHTIEVKQARDQGFEEGEKLGFEKAEFLTAAKQKAERTSQHKKPEIDKAVGLGDQLAREAVLLTTKKGTKLTKKNGHKLLSLAKRYIKLRGINLFADLEIGADSARGVRS